MTSKEMIKVAYEALADKKGEDIRIIEISEISTIADYFIIASGSSNSQISALVDNVDEKLGKMGVSPKRVEGARSQTWVLMDYGDIIVHVFMKEDRLFYDLERIWKDGKFIEVEEL